MEKTKKLNKLILVPLLAAIAEFVKQMTGYTVPIPYIDFGADILLWVISFIGIRMKWHVEVDQTASTSKAYNDPVYDADNMI
jgi:hypothetical protein